MSAESRYARPQRHLTLTDWERRSGVVRWWIAATEMAKSWQSQQPSARSLTRHSQTHLLAMAHLQCLPLHTLHHHQAGLLQSQEDLGSGPALYRMPQRELLMAGTCRCLRRRRVQGRTPEARPETRQSTAMAKESRQQAHKVGTPHSCGMWGAVPRTLNRVRAKWGAMASYTAWTCCSSWAAGSGPVATGTGKGLGSLLAITA